MGTLGWKVARLLTQRFQPPARVHLRDGDGLLGTVTSAEFRGLEMVDRVDLIWDSLGDRLTPAERRAITLIVPQTPEEAEVIEAEDQPSVDQGRTTHA